MRKKEVEKLEAKKPPRACFAQVPIRNLRILDPSLLVCAHRNLLSRLLGAGRSCPCFSRCSPRHKVESGGRPLDLVDLLVEIICWVSTSGLRESSPSCSCSRGSRVCVTSFSSEFLCDCCQLDWLFLWRLCFFLFLCLMSSFLFCVFFLMYYRKNM